jgi:hypothetical protein
MGYNYSHEMSKRPATLSAEAKPELCVLKREA